MAQNHKMLSHFRDIFLYRLSGVILATFGKDGGEFCAVPAAGTLIAEPVKRMCLNVSNETLGKVIEDRTLAFVGLFYR